MRSILNKIVVLIVTLCVFLTGAQSFSAVAAESENEKTASGVLEDLSKDASFNAANYPSNAKDYSLSVMQLAESTDKELFVYVYQPSGDKVKASSVNISATINDNISYHNYKLELLNFDGTLFKYKVAGFEVKADPVRYYVISNIYRPFDESIGDKKSGNNTINEVNYAVNKQYCFGEINGKSYVNCIDIETIVVTDKFVGFVRYKDGFKLYVGACDSHFVAFNTDKPIDKLLEADVYYTTKNTLHRGRHLSEKRKRSGIKQINTHISNTPTRLSMQVAVGLQERINGTEFRRLTTSLKAKTARIFTTAQFLTLRFHRN